MLRPDDLRVESFATTAAPAALAIPTTTVNSPLGCTEYSCYTICPLDPDGTQ
jgi:hypothetical protein